MINDMVCTSTVAYLPVGVAVLVLVGAIVEEVEVLVEVVVVVCRVEVGVVVFGGSVTVAVEEVVLVRTELVEDEDEAVGMALVVDDPGGAVTFAVAWA